MRSLKGCTKYGDNVDSGLYTPELTTMVCLCVLQQGHTYTHMHTPLSCLKSASLKPPGK